MEEPVSGVTVRHPSPGELWDARLEPILALTRGGWPETVYRGVWVETDPAGVVLGGVGDPDVPVHLRSAAKPFQALALVESGAARALAFSERELAMACASHSGSADQVAVVERLLSRLGFCPQDLECGSAPPLDAHEARRLESVGVPFGPQHHMCSGKHAAMLALARHLGVSPAGYSLPSHPVQQLIFSTIAREAGLTPRALYGGIDGCGVPVVRLPARVGATLYARLAVGATPALALLRDAMMAHPDLVAGEGRLDTRVMRAAAGLVVSKTGAAAVLGLGRLSPDGCPAGGRGCLVKMAADPGPHLRAVAAAALWSWDLLRAGDCVWPESEQRVTNGVGAEVGGVELVARLARQAPGSPSSDDKGGAQAEIGRQGAEPEAATVSLEPIGPTLAVFLEREWPAAERESLGRSFAWSAQPVGAAARRQGHVVGVATGNLVGGVLELAELLVASCERGRGVGGALLAAVEGETWRRGGHRVCIAVWAGSAAEDFYRHRGYVRLALVPRHYQQGTQALLAKDRVKES